MLAEMIQATTETAAAAQAAGFNWDAGKLIGGIGGLLVSGVAGWKLWYRKNTVDNAGAALDVSALGAGKGMIETLQADIARLRDTQSSNEAKWQADMQRLQDRLDLMSKQVDDALARARAAEETSARLRAQIIGLNAQPVA